MKVKSLRRVQLFVTPWTAAYQAPPSMGFSRQEYWSGVPLPSPICIYSHILNQSSVDGNLSCFKVFFPLTLRRCKFGILGSQSCDSACLSVELVLRKAKLRHKDTSPNILFEYLDLVTHQQVLSWNL